MSVLKKALLQIWTLCQESIKSVKPAGTSPPPFPVHRGPRLRTPRQVAQRAQTYVWRPYLLATTRKERRAALKKLKALHPDLPVVTSEFEP